MFQLGSVFIPEANWNPGMVLWQATKHWQRVFSELFGRACQSCTERVAGHVENEGLNNEQLYINQQVAPCM